MSYRIEVTPIFEKQLKRLNKKYPSIKKDILELVEKLEDNPEIGVLITQDCYKIRLKISSKNKGKSSGARIISYLYRLEQIVYLLSIYDKSEIDNISDKEIQNIINDL